MNKSEILDIILFAPFVIVFLLIITFTVLHLMTHIKELWKNL